MALFNKLFASRKKSFNKGQGNVCERCFTFTKDQVRVTVFRECDFRGRKLLFDSDSVQKIALNLDRDKKDEEKNLKQFIEVTNGYGYTYTKPNCDVLQLREMVFGSVAMSYRGTTFKIHKLDSPAQIICSQVFLSPSRIRHSVPSQTHSLANSSSLEQSIRFEDSGTSSATSCSDQSVQSTGSDLLVCRRPQSKPLDVPKNSSLISSSGYGGGHSMSSLSSGPQSIPIDLSQNGSRRWLNNAGTSFEFSTSSLGNLSSDNFSKSRTKGTKIGIALILHLTKNDEEKLEQFFMEHTTLIENQLWKIRQCVESVYLRHNTFISVLYEIAQSTAQWFVDLVTGPFLATHLWHSIVPYCDNSISIKAKTSIHFEHLHGSLVQREEKSIHSSSTFFNSIKSDIFNMNETNSEQTFISRLLKTDSHSKLLGNDVSAEKFIKEFCDLIENIDAKHTNFFISTLVTAVLTHHLGWVPTALPNNLKQELSKTDNPFLNQLKSLYGSVGNPTKMAQTIIVGTNHSELISKLINALTYFIRCSNLRRNFFTRIDDIHQENDVADKICLENECIPKENYKKYVDHLKEIEEISNNNKMFNNLIIDKPILFKSKQLEMTKTFTCLTNLDKICDEEETNSRLETKENLCLSNSHLQLIDINEAKQQIQRMLPPRRKSNFTLNNNANMDENEDKNVLFVLGENEKLVGLKRDDKILQSNVCNINNETKKLKPSISSVDVNKFSPTSSKEEMNRAQSEPPEIQKTDKNPYRYQGVKFNFQQHPQIFENYMKSKSIELSNIQLSEKVNLDEKFTNKTLNFDQFNGCSEFEEEEPLQTPSNATELEFTSDLIIAKPELQKAKHIVEDSVKKSDFVRNYKENTLINETSIKNKDNYAELKVIELPMPSSKELSQNYNIVYTSSLIRGLSNNYVSNMVLQGTSLPIHQWQSILKKDLSLSAKYPLINEPMDESIAIIANIDTWEVQLISSHTYVIDKGVSGVPVGMSQLVANMLESLLYMKKLQTPVEYCLMHIEQRLQEFCIRSKALAQLLLDTDFCSMDLLTSTLKLEINDVPLLMAIASVHTPQVTQKYGLSFQ